MNNTSQNLGTGYAATEECWFKTTNGYNTGGVLMALADTNSGSANVFERLLWMDDTGKMNFGVSSSGLHILSTTSSYNDGNWHLVDASLGGAGQKLYIDGALIVSGATPTGQADTTAYWRWGFAPFNGWSPVPDTFYFNGTLDEITVYNTQLADSAVTTNYNSNY